ncbi:MAG: hypothetical protein AAF611_00055 [Bacteroidota bacterium]
MKTILIIIAIWIILMIIINANKERKSKKAYKKYLDHLKKLNTICSKFGVQPQEAGDSYLRIESELKKKRKEIADMIDAGKLTNFYSKHELNETFNSCMDLIEESIELFVKWENISNPV